LNPARKPESAGVLAGQRLVLGEPRPLARTPRLKIRYGP
jgi:hypothetical protein